MGLLRRAVLSQDDEKIIVGILRSVCFYAENPHEIIIV